VTVGAEAVSTTSPLEPIIHRVASTTGVAVEGVGVAQLTEAERFSISESRVTKSTTASSVRRLSWESGGNPPRPVTTNSLCSDDLPG